MKKTIKFRLGSSVALLTLAALAVFSAFPASAADFVNNGGSQTKTLEVPSSTVSRNLYAAGAQLTVNASPTKDLTAAGASVNVNGNVGDDLLAAGANLNISGSVGGSARLAGANIYISSPSIGEDLVIAGSTVYIRPGSEIKGDLVVLANSVVVDGRIDGSIRMRGGSLTVNGEVDGNVDATVSGYLQLGSTAQVKGNINYQAPQQLIQDTAAKVGGSISYAPLPVSDTIWAVFTLFTLIRIIAGLLVALGLFVLFRRRFTALVQGLAANFWPSVGIGFIGMIVVPVIAVILLITIIGYYAALILAAWFVLLLLFSAIIGAAYFGSWALAMLQRAPVRDNIRVDYWTVILGVVLFEVLRLVPLLGWIFAIVLAFAGFGTMLKAFARARTE